MNKPTEWISRKIAHQIFEDDILAKDNSLVIIAVIARGGAGKTYLARDLGYKLGSPDGYEKAALPGQPRWSGILDLYDSEVNSNPGLEKRLLEAFKASPMDFEEYLSERQYYETRLKTGVRDRELEQQRHKVEQAFGRGMVNAAQKNRLVIALDTVERLQNAIDRVQQITGFANDTATVKGWLLNQFVNWSNSVLLLFGRPAGTLWDEIETFIQNNNRQPGEPSIRFKKIYLDSLEPEEAPDFFDFRLQRYPDLKPAFTPSFQKLLLEKTEGVPLLMDLALEAMAHSGNLSATQNSLESGAFETVKRQLVDSFFNSQNTYQQMLLRYLAAARRGLHQNLLAELEPKSHPELWQVLEGMREIPFIKYRRISALGTTPENEQQDAYFLHDEMYLLCDRYLFHTPKQVIEITNRILNWYISREAECDEDKKQRQNIEVESLYYRLRVDPESGYKKYLQLVDEAIRSAQISYDILLTNELYQFARSAFPQTEEQKLSSSQVDQQIAKKSAERLMELVDLDTATLWIKRFTIRGDTPRARKIGEQVLPNIEQYCERDHPGFLLAWGELIVFYAQALMYMGSVDESLIHYQEVIDALGLKLANDHFTKEERTFELWRTDLILGRAHNNIGYLYWLYKGQYNLALKELQRAIKFFRTSDVREEIANTADNMGRIHALLGHRIQAETQVDDGLTLRRRLNLPYREALSLNSLAIVKMHFERPDQALPVAEQALTILRTMNVQRGIGLVRITIGRACRLLSESWRQPGNTLEIAKNYSQRSEVELSDALSIFTERVNEPIRLFEAYNEIGRTLRARYEMYLNDPQSQNLIEPTFSQAQINLTRAIRQARTEKNAIQISDSCQDMAVLYFLAGQWSNVETWLREAENSIPQEYKIQNGVGLPEIPEDEQIIEYYRMMGKVELLRGNLSMAKEPQRPTGETILSTTFYYLLASAYFNQFSRDTPELLLTYRQMYNQLKKSRLELVNRILKEEMPQWVEQYRLPENLLVGFYRDVFGLFE